MEVQRNTLGATATDIQQSIVGDRYLLQGRVCDGRLGDVYEAVDRQLDKAGHGNYRVIIELYELRPNQAGLGERFASQFVQILSISHPNIARVIDFGIDGTTVYFTTELLEGTSLRAVLDGVSTDSFTENEVLGVLGSVTDALRHIHTKGLVHGDLTPDSIFITNNLEVKIADFASSILKQTLDSSTAELNGISMLPRLVDDTYGLAAVSYEMLSNNHPFNGASRRQAQAKGLTPGRIKGIPRHRWKAFSNALNTQIGKRGLSIDEFANQFGIGGTERIRETETDSRTKSRRLWLPVTLIVASGLIGMWQIDDTSFRELLSDFQERASVQLDAILLTGRSVAENDATITAAVIPEEQISIPEEATLPSLVTSTPVFPAVPADNIDIELSFDQIKVESDPARQTGAALSALPVVLDDQVVVAEEKLVPALAASGYEVADTEPLSISFEQEFVTAYESSGMAAISIERQGAIGDEVSIIWWTAENSAMENQDYADFGVRTETLKAGQTSVTIYVPLVVDSHREPRESFYVYAGPAAAPKQNFGMLEVFVMDGRN